MLLASTGMSHPRQTSTTTPTNPGHSPKPPPPSPLSHHHGALLQSKGVGPMLMASTGLSHPLHQTSIIAATNPGHSPKPALPPSPLSHHQGALLQSMTGGPMLLASTGLSRSLSRCLSHSTFKATARATRASSKLWSSRKCQCHEAGMVGCGWGDVKRCGRASKVCVEACKPPLRREGRRSCHKGIQKAPIVWKK